MSSEELKRAGKEIDTAMSILHGEAWCNHMDEEKKKLHIAFHLGVLFGINKNIEYDASFGFLYGKQYSQLMRYVGFIND